MLRLGFPRCSRRRTQFLAILFFATAVFPQFGMTASFSAFGETDRDENRIENRVDNRIESRVVSLGLFKNGLFVVTEEATLPGPGDYSLGPLPTPIHGTFFVESGSPVTVIATHEEVETNAEDHPGGIDFGRDLAGRDVVIHLKDGSTLEGTVSERSAEDSPGVSPNSSPNAEQFHPFSSASAALPFRSADGPLTIRLKEDGRLVILPNPSEIVRIDCVPGEKMNPVKEKRPVLRIKTFPQTVANQTASDQTASKTPSGKPVSEAGPIPLRISYLARGMTWAPEYRVQLSENGPMTLIQNGVIINEWRDVQDAEIDLISGFPQISFENVTSPLSSGSTMTQFFQSLSRGQSGESNSINPMFNQAVMMNQAVMGTVPASETVNVAELEKSLGPEGIDTFYKSVGKISLRRGDRLFTEIGRGNADWKKVVCWNIPESRDDDGRPLANRGNPMNLASNYGSTVSGNPFMTAFSEPWDTVVFRNPLDYPMTTAPATVFEGKTFLGQSSLFWTNPGEETRLPVNKSLSVRVASKEWERTESDVAMDKTAEEDAFHSAPPTPNSSSRQNAVNFAPQVPPLQAKDGDPSEKANPFFTSSEPSPTKKTLRVNGIDYRWGIIDAEITIVNRRSEEISMTVRRQISGELSAPNPKAENTPTPPDSQTVLTQSRGVNPKRELVWNFTLQPGETRLIAFSYVLWILQ